MTYEKVAEDTAGIETAGVGEADFLLDHCECVCDVDVCKGKREEGGCSNGSTKHLVAREKTAVTHPRYR